MSNSLERHLGAFPNPAQNQAWRGLMRVIDVIRVKTGIGVIDDLVDPSAKTPSSSLRVSTPVVPPAAFFTVTGIDGKFIVTIENPENILALSPAILLAQARVNINAQARGIWHNLQSATDINFSNASNLKDYGVSPQLMWTDQDPNVTRFFRLRSSYDRKNWNQWQIFLSTLQCGPVGVASGALRSIAQMFAPPGNSTNFATVDSIDAGASATIRVYGTGGVGSSWQRQTGNTLVGPDNTPNTVFPGASLTGFAYTTTYTVFYDTKNAVYHVFTAAQFSSSLNDEYVFAGQVTTIAHGGGGGTSGGGGNGGGTGGGRYNQLT